VRYFASGAKPEADRVCPEGFGYKWSSAIKWEDLIARKVFTVKCSHTDEKEAAFRFHACVEADLNDPNAKYVNDTLITISANFYTSKYPKINLKLRAPIELENLLPYNLEYRIYDKNTDQNWRSYLRKGGVMPVHSVELGHLVLLNVAVQDTGKECLHLRRLVYSSEYSIQAQRVRHHQCGCTLRL
jgi:vacuolar protein sorting-associated protein 13A/C